MADSNTIYNGVKEYFDPKGDSGIPNFGTRNWFGRDGSNYWLEETPIWPELDRINKESASTIAGVIVPYAAGSNRTQWLQDRIKAIDARVEFNRGRVSGLIDSIKGTNGDVAVALEKGFTAALSALPYIGGVISGVAAGAEANRRLEAFKVQTLVQQYTEDIKQLAAIRAQLSKEYVGSGGSEKELGPKQKAPGAIPTYYYYLGAFLILLMLLYLRNRNQRK